MKLKSIKLVPSLIVLGVIGLVCLLRILPVYHPSFDLFQRLEWGSYDWRVRQALRFSEPIESRIGYIAIDDVSIANINDKDDLGYNFGLYWPRQIYGYVVRELAAESARAVAFDVLMPQLRPDHPPVRWPGKDGVTNSDEFFAQQMQRSSNVIIAAARELPPANLFFTSALRVGHVASEKDSDGIMRRVHPYEDLHILHPFLESAFEVTKTNIVFVLNDDSRTNFPVKDGHFDVTLLGVIPGPGEATNQPVYHRYRAWNEGIILAALELGLDLDKAEVSTNQIVLRGPNGLLRTIPLDESGCFYIDWSLPVLAGVTNVTHEPIFEVLKRDVLREHGHPGPSVWNGKLVVVGSVATGNDLSDVGATPLQKESFLVSSYWNIARSVLDDHFIRPAPLWLEFVLIALMGIVAAVLTWHLRAISALAALILLVALYHVLAVWLFVEYRYWIPLVLPTLTAIFYVYVSLMTYRVIFEQREQRRVKGIFSKIVTPDVVNELLTAESLSLVGARREITVYFADVRGFTQLTDVSQARAEDYVRRHNLTGLAAEQYHDQQAAEMLATVNQYLSNVAGTIMQHRGTLDKYIGDCVMAFWGAPVPNERHAVDCVRAAIDAQRAIEEMKKRREQENKRREQENVTRVAAGQEPLSLLPILSLGSGINSGIATVGLMGSDEHIINYTVFGREVNLASRLEGLSGKGRIIIGETTYQYLRKYDPDLAAQCIAQPPAQLKGFSGVLKNYEVPWKQAEAAPPGAAVKPEAAGVALDAPKLEEKKG